MAIFGYSADYPERDFPWTFYFNGVALPKWGWCWNFIKFNGSQENWDSDVGPRDIYILNCRIDHVGTIESAEPEIFRYAAQEALCVLMENKESIFEEVRKTKDFPASPDDVYHDLVEASFQMRELIIQTGRAFWTRGYEADRLRLVEAIRRASLPENHSEHESPPHVKSFRSQLKSINDWQVKKLHQIASSGGLSKEMRKRLFNF